MAEPDPLRTVEQLVELSRWDWGYADLYLQDAERTLRPLLTPHRYEELARGRESLPRLAAESRRAIQRGDWSEAERLAEAALGLRHRIEREARLLKAAEPIYGARTLSPDSSALAFAAGVAYPAGVLRSRLRELAETLRGLAGTSELATFHAHRAERLEQLELELEEDAAPSLDPSDLRDAALEAAETGDFAGLLRAARAAKAARRDRAGRTRASRPQPERVEGLEAPFPAIAVDRAAKLGLEPLSLSPRSDLNAYLSCGCAERARLPEAPLAEGHREPEGCTCGHACPPGVPKSLRDSLDALMVHPFVTSGATRYLPWLGAETVLVEAFSEEDVDAAEGILHALDLPKRRGLTRLAIEDALLRHGPRICREFGLEPEAHRLVCVPFDLYLRAGPERGWGRRKLWTHFDGYQVTRELRLQALVGGDVRYGGPEDLCGVGRAYDSDHIAARFAIVRRGRFLAREPTAEA